MGASSIVVGLLVTFQAVTLDTLFTVGSIDGPEESSFARVTDVEIGPGDTTFVIDVADPHVRVFDGEGRFVRMFGRRGGGPGELTRPTNAQWLDSTLVVRHGGTVTEFRPDGEFVRLWRPPIEGWIMAVVPVGDDAHLVLKGGVGRRSGTDQVQELFLVDGRGIESLASGVSGSVFHRGPSSWGALVTGICGTLSISYVGGGAFLLGDGEHGEITLYRGARPVTTFDVAPEAGSIPDEVEDQVRDLAGRTSWGRRDPDSHQLIMPRIFSTVCHVQSESAERAWFRRNGYRDDPEEWQAVDLETGELTASFRLEPGMRVESIRAGRVAGVWQDDLGVSYVTVFALPEG